MQASSVDSDLRRLWAARQLAQHFRRPPGKGWQRCEPIANPGATSCDLHHFTWTSCDFGAQKVTRILNHGNIHFSQQYSLQPPPFTPHTSPVLSLWADHDCIRFNQKKLQILGLNPKISDRSHRSMVEICDFQQLRLQSQPPKKSQPGPPPVAWRSLRGPHRR